MVTHITDILEHAPSNWGEWGDGDEVGALNYLTSDEVLRGIEAVERGETFTLGLPIGRDSGDPVWPTRSGAEHYMTKDNGVYEAGKADRTPYGHWRASDDVIHMYTHGTTHLDSLGHVWYDGELYNGFDADTTNGGLARCGIENAADHGVMGRGVLLDIARHRGVEYLRRGERVTLDELRACADDQGVDLHERDIVLLRLGALELFYDEGPDAFYDEYAGMHGDDPVLVEPGITYTEELVEWLHSMEIPVFGTDTVTAEQTVSEETDTRLPLHPALLRDQGLVISEMNKLDELAADCAVDDTYDFLYVSSPLKLVGATGSPINPLAVK